MTLRYGVARRAFYSSGFEGDLLQDACERLLGYCRAKLGAQRLGQPFKLLGGVLSKYRGSEMTSATNEPFSDTTDVVWRE
jgi:hypothetical protein